MDTDKRRQGIKKRKDLGVSQILSLKSLWAGNLLPNHENGIAKQKLSVFPEATEERIIRHVNHGTASEILNTKYQAII